MSEKLQEIVNRVQPYAIGFIAGVAAVKMAKYVIHKKRIVQSAPIQEESNLLPHLPIPKDLILPFKQACVFFGEIEGDYDHCVGKPLGIDGHVIVYGPPGSGKTTGIVEQTLERANGFNVIVDIKGDLARKHRQRCLLNGKKCLVFSPYDPDISNCWYDVFSVCRQEPDYIPDHAYQIGNTLIPAQPADHNQVWSKGAANFTTGILINSVKNDKPFPDAMKTLVEKRIGATIEDVLRDKKSKEEIGFVSKFLEGDKSLKGIGLELTNQLALLAGSAAVQNAFRPSDGKELLDWEQLNRPGDPFDVIIVIPEDKLVAAKQIMTIMINQLIESLQRRAGRSYDDNELPPVLLVLDEMQRLGMIPALKEGLTTLRSRGVTFLMCVQSIAGLEEQYGAAGTRVILDNCDYHVVLRCNDVSSQQHFSDLFGVTAVQQEGVSISCSAGGSLTGVSIGGGVSKNYVEAYRPLIFPAEFRTLEGIAVASPYGSFLTKKHCLSHSDEVDFDISDSHIIDPPTNCAVPVSQLEVATGKKEVE